MSARCPLSPNAYYSVWQEQPAPGSRLSRAADLLREGRQRRADRDFEGAHAALVNAFAQARASSQTQLMVEIALMLPSVQGFGQHPGRIPALVHEAYSLPLPATQRTRLAATLAKAWAYGGDEARAARYARESEELALPTGDPQLIAEALDAQLLAGWGPDLVSQRASLAARLVDVAAHQTDLETQLAAYNWRLTTAWESLDLLAVQRQLRALDLLAQESGSPRVAFFAAARRAMYLLTMDQLDAAAQAIETTRTLGDTAGEPDAYGVEHSLRAELALHRGDWAVVRAEARLYEEFAEAEGIPSVMAQAALLHLSVDEGARAAAILDRFLASGLSAIRKDVDFLLTSSQLLRVAARLHAPAATDELILLLEPYAGRVVLNAGAVTFHGVVDDYLADGYDSLDRPGATGYREFAALTYRRIGASWWLRHVGPIGTTTAERPPVTMRLAQQPSGLWEVGAAQRPAVLPDLKGLHHLARLVANPGTGMPARVLSDAAAGHTETPVLDQGVELLDGTALGAYRARLLEIDDELADADACGDQTRSAALASEQAAILDQLRTATGLGGRQRRTPSAAERARVAVRKAIAAALDRIEEADPALARILRSCVSTGSVCQYDPDPDRAIVWILTGRG